MLKQAGHPERSEGSSPESVRFAKDPSGVALKDDKTGIAHKDDKNGFHSNDRSMRPEWK
jgi:hypothetical protein